MPREVLEKFDFDNTISKLDEAGSFSKELIRKFNEALNENPGEHFTPRDVVHLMVDLMLAGDEREIRARCRGREGAGRRARASGSDPQARARAARHARQGPRRFRARARCRCEESRREAPCAGRKAILSALSEPDETATICRDEDGNPEPDPDLRDEEIEGEIRGIEQDILRMLAEVM